MGKKVICWWSGGITSAVACKLGIDLFGKENCRVVMQDTQNEHEDTYRFKSDCEKWYGLPIEVITGIGEKYKSIQDVWTTHLSLNTATGAICSTNLKRLVREQFEKENNYEYQIFGFEFEANEFKRAKSLKMNHPKAKSIYPLLMYGYTKTDCIEIVQTQGIAIPMMYVMGYQNNNCFKTGCVQGGVGYWQKIRREDEAKFNAMAEMEHKLTDLKGTPITMLKDQSNEGKAKKEANKKGDLVFLLKHPNYPDHKCLDDMPPCKVEPLFECNGFCGTNDLAPRTETEKQINFETEN